MSSRQPEVTPEIVAAHGLSQDEYQLIIEKLGREPNFTELGLFSVMWSEHCSYKSSRVHLRKLPTEGGALLQGPGENAGAVDLGDGWAAVFKIESHNHPSFVEPYQGAATGVGGILRDIFTMGARPVASLNSLRFGEPEHPRTRYLLEGVVAGIGGYGNCIGVPTVGGEIRFHPSYNGNILVNVFNLGFVRSDRIFKGVAKGEGNPVIYVGARTGRDGIHGASLLASAEFDAESESKRPTVQVGDPFTEKLLLEACLELMQSDAIVGIQDMGAAGLSCSSCEMASRGHVGIELDLDRVPRRETGMTPYEMLLSESQERMLLVAKDGREKDVLQVFERWGLQAAVVGRVTADDAFTVTENGEVVARVPARALADEAPAYERPTARPGWLDELQQLDHANLEQPADLGAVLLELMGGPNLCSREWVWTQYDHSIGTNTLYGPGHDAALIRVKGTDKAVAIALDGNGRYCQLDPRAGARLAVAEAARNVSCLGARPLGLTDGLNFGNPERPEVMWQFAEAVEGLAEACRALELPVVGGNCSFYNETEGRAIVPTPIVGVVGLIDPAHKARPVWFSEQGDLVVLVGETLDELGGSEYLASVHGLERGLPPTLDFEREARAQQLVREALAAEFLSSAHDLSDGGLAVALAECCLGPQGLGARLRLESGLRPDVALYAETPSRYLLSLPPECLDGVAGMAEELGVPLLELGEVGGDALVIELGTARVELAVKTIRERWQQGLAHHVLEREPRR